MSKLQKKNTKKSSTKPAKANIKKVVMVERNVEEFSSDPVSVSESPSYGSMRWGTLIVGLLFIVGIYAATKGYIVAALVNGSPVFRWDVTAMMTSRYGQQTLESIISERLIADAARKQGVAITQQDIDAKTTEVVKSLGPNVKLEDLLKYQGMNKTDFEHQISLQLTVEKILGKDVSVSDQEVNEFIEKNKETMVATDEAAMRGEAREALQSQKINEKIQPWFAKLKESAKVVRLMK